MSTHDTRGQMMTTTWSEMRSYATATADMHTAMAYGKARAYCAWIFGDDAHEKARLDAQIGCDIVGAVEAEHSCCRALCDVLDTAADRIRSIIEEA